MEKPRFDGVVLRGFQGKLEQRRRELAVELSKYGVIVPLERCPDTMDAVRADMDNAFAMGLRKLAVKNLGLVCAALKKIEKTPESYGVCEDEDCAEGEISLKRLMAVPWAKYCRGCQENADAEAHMQAHESSAYLDEIRL